MKLASSAFQMVPASIISSQAQSFLTTDTLKKNAFFFPYSVEEKAIFSR